MPFRNSYQFNSDNTQTLTQLIQGTADNHSKLLPIRLDLYLSSQDDSAITYIDIKNCWQNLQRNMRHNSIFDNLLAWAANIEYGEHRGWHIHVLMLFNGQRLKDDYTKAQDLGAYWMKLVKQRDNRYTGDYYSANTHANKYDTLALKIIDSSRSTYKNDLATLIDASTYLTKVSCLSEAKMKDEEAFQQRSEHHQSNRRFFTSHVKSKSKRGRPRNLDSLAKDSTVLSAPTPRRRPSLNHSQTVSNVTTQSRDNFDMQWAYTASLLND